MYHNISTRMKRTAVFLGWLGILGSIVLGVMKVLASRQLGRWELEVEMATEGWLIMILGVIGSRVLSILLYSFGQLVENSDIIRRHLERQDSYSGASGVFRTTPYTPEEPQR